MCGTYLFIKPRLSPFFCQINSMFLAKPKKRRINLTKRVDILVGFCAENDASGIVFGIKPLDADVYLFCQINSTVLNFIQKTSN